MLNMTTANVVTMEYVPGIKINDISRIEEAGIDRTLLAQRSAEAYLTQLCRHGFFRKYLSYLYALHLITTYLNALCCMSLCCIASALLLFCYAMLCSADKWNLFVHLLWLKECSPLDSK
jgi:hypothetical protein